MSLASRSTEADRTAQSTRSRSFVVAAVVASAAVMLGAGAWAFFAPASFADAVGFADGGHFVHDAGAFQLGLGATLLLSLIVRNALTVALGGYSVGALFHVASHVADGGEGRYGGLETAAVAVTAVVALVALALQLRGVEE